MNAMAFIPVPGVVLLEMRYTQFGQKMENTLYFRKPTSWTIEEMEDLAADVYVWWAAGPANNQHSGVTFDAINVTDLTTETAPGIEWTTSLPDPGLAAGVPLPGNATATVTFLTALRGRSFRGRNYIIGLTTNQVTGNTLNTGARDEWRDYYNDLLTAITDPTVDWVVVSKYGEGAPRATGIYTPIIGVRVEPNMDSQRRRLNGRGE